MKTITAELLLATVLLTAPCGCGAEPGGSSSGADSGALNDETAAEETAVGDTGTDPWADTADLFADTGSAPVDTGTAIDAPTDAPSDSELEPTFLSKRGAPIFDDNFSDGSYKPDWQVIGGTWSVVDGRLIGSGPPGEADPNIGRMASMDRTVLQFSFRLPAAGRAGIRLNSKGEAPQHLVNISITPDTVTLSEMTGWSSATTSKKLKTTPVTLTPGKWYTAVLEVLGNNVSFAVDGKPIVSGTTVDQSATPRNHFVFQAFGENVGYDDVRAWQALKP